MVSAAVSPGRGGPLAGLCAVRGLQEGLHSHRGEGADGGELRLAHQDPALRQAEVRRFLLH